MGRKAKEERRGALRADVAALTEEIRGARKASEATAQIAADQYARMEGIQRLRKRGAGRGAEEVRARAGVRCPVSGDEARKAEAPANTKGSLKRERRSG